MSSNDKKTSRLRRAKKTRAHIRRLGENRLCVYRSPRHIYAQIFDVTGDRVLVSASTVEKAVRDGMENTGNVNAAQVVGTAIAARAKAAGIERVAFDRSGYKYHGRIKALADAARDHGLKF